MFTWENDPTIERVRRARGLGVAAPIPDSGARSAAVSPSAAREPAMPQAEPLSSVARVWLTSLPAGLRPAQLCARYPRVANRLALCWPDRGLALRLFDDLLVDRRGGRRGFPAEVKAELVALRDRASREKALRVGESETLLQRLLSDVA